MATSRLGEESQRLTWRFLACIADFCRRNHIRWLALFGSAVRGDFHPDSIAVHHYFGVSWGTVWNTAAQDAPFLRERIAAILAAEFPDEG